MKALHRTILLVVAGLLAATTLSITSTASAAAPARARVTSTAADGDAAQPRHRRYAAIALSRPDVRGTRIANEKRTKRRAKQVAVRKCRNNSRFPGTCFTKVWVSNGCAAVAAKLRLHDGGRVSIRRAAAGLGRTPTQAKRRAKRNLPGSGGRILAWVCTHRHY